MSVEPTPSPSELGRALQDVTELTQKIVHDEIELAKAEVSTKVSKLAKGAAIGAAGGVFGIFGLVYILHAMSWFIWKLLRGDSQDNFYLGFLIVGVLLFLLAGLAAFLAYKLVKRGSPPTPQMAIDEGKKVRQTFSNS